MTPAESLVVVAMIEAAFEHEFPEPTKAVWLEMLGDLDFERTRLAAKELIATETNYVPRVGALRQAVLTQRNGLPPPDEAWRDAVLSVRARGWDGDHSDVHPDVARAAEVVGWRAIGMSNEDDTWVQRHFMQIYQARADRVTRENQIVGLSGDTVPELEAGKG